MATITINIGGRRPSNGSSQNRIDEKESPKPIKQQEEEEDEENCSSESCNLESPRSPSPINYFLQKSELPILVGSGYKFLDKTELLEQLLESTQFDSEYDIPTLQGVNWYKSLGSGLLFKRYSKNILKTIQNGNEQETNKFLKELEALLVSHKSLSKHHIFYALLLLLRAMSFEGEYNRQFLDKLLPYKKIFNFIYNYCQRNEAQELKVSYFSRLTQDEVLSANILQLIYEITEIWRIISIDFSDDAWHPKILYHNLSKKLQENNKRDHIVYTRGHKKIENGYFHLLYFPFAESLSEEELQKLFRN